MNDDAGTRRDRMIGYLATGTSTLVVIVFVLVVSEVAVPGYVWATIGSAATLAVLSVGYSTTQFVQARRAKRIAAAQVGVS